MQTTLIPPDKHELNQKIIQAIDKQENPHKIRELIQIADKTDHKSIKTPYHEGTLEYYMWIVKHENVGIMVMELKRVLKKSGRTVRLERLDLFIQKILEKELG